MIELNLHDESYSMILKYLDGELPEMEHQRMFVELADNPLLQRDLTAMLSMRTTLQNDVPPPPPILEEAVVGKLFVPQTSKASAFIRTRDGIFWALLSSLITLLIVGYPNNTAKQREQKIQTTHDVTNHNLRNTSAEHTRNTLHILSSIGKSTDNIRKVVKHNTGHHYTNPLLTVSEAKQSSTSVDGKTSNQDEQVSRIINSNDEWDDYTEESSPVPMSSNDLTESGITSETITKSVSLLSSTNVSTDDTRNTPSLMSASPEQSANTNTPKCRAEMRLFSMQSYPNVALPGLITPPINNFALTMSYSLSAEHSIGIEVGQENQFQRFTTNIDDRLVNIEQNYLAWWVGVAYQYSPQTEWFGIVHPFLRGSIGATKIGPIGRAITGIELPLMQRMSLMAGCEGMAGLSWQKGNAIGTMKLGFCTGISIRF